MIDVPHACDELGSRNFRDAFNTDKSRGDDEHDGLDKLLEGLNLLIEVNDQASELSDEGDPDFLDRASAFEGIGFIAVEDLDLVELGDFLFVMRLDVGQVRVELVEQSGSLRNQISPLFDQKLHFRGLIFLFYRMKLVAVLKDDPGNGQGIIGIRLRGIV